ncbi:MAG: hypothetical protein R3F38_07065 [Gammaproteobacteria bacterium]
MKGHQKWDHQVQEGVLAVPRGAPGLGGRRGGTGSRANEGNPGIRGSRGTLVRKVAR